MTEEAFLLLACNPITGKWKMNMLTVVNFYKGNMKAYIASNPRQCQAVASKKNIKANRGIQYLKQLYNLFILRIVYLYFL